MWRTSGWYTWLNPVKPLYTLLSFWQLGVQILSCQLPRTASCVKFCLQRQFWISGEHSRCGQTTHFLSPTISLNFSLSPLMLSLWKKVYDQPRQHIKKQRHYFVNKGLYSQGYGFSSSHVWMWELDYKESWAQKNWCFWTVVLEKTLESPLECKEIQPVYPGGDQSWVFIGRTDAEAETLILSPPDAKSWLIWKDTDVGKDWRQEEKGTTEDEMVGWHHWLNGCEFG